MPIINSSSIAALLIVISFTALIHYFNHRFLTILAIIILIVLSIFIPYFIAFLPLMCFTLLDFDLKKLILLLAIPVIVNYSFFRIDTLVLILVMTIIAGVMRYICNELGNLIVENKKTRDNSIELQLALQKKNKALTENYEEDIYHVTLKERNRIAREIHDNVGHLLARSILQIGAVQAIIESKHFKDSTRFTKELFWTREDFIEDSIEDFIDDSIENSITDSLDSLKVTLDSAMTSVRQSVHNLRDDSINLQEAITKMIEPMACEVEFSYEIAQDIENSIKLCFLGVLKEAITNISKHSNATKVVITLKEQPAFYQLLIQDNGLVQKRILHEHPHRMPGGSNNSTNVSDTIQTGMGIENMIERVEMLDGYINISTKDGFKIFISIPKQVTK
jgi:signal transduction histidine kinase